MCELRALNVTLNFSRSQGSISFAQSYSLVVEILAKYVGFVCPTKTSPLLISLSFASSRFCKHTHSALSLSLSPARSLKLIFTRFFRYSSSWTSRAVVSLLKKFLVNDYSVNSIRRIIFTEKERDTDAYVIKMQS